eukprot:1158744-Pelagomonas_calceolata.AAC.16
MDTACSLKSLDGAGAEQAKGEKEQVEWYFHRGMLLQLRPPAYPACKITTATYVSDVNSIMLRAHLCREHPEQKKGQCAYCSQTEQLPVPQNSDGVGKHHVGLFQASWVKRPRGLIRGGRGGGALARSNICTEVEITSSVGMNIVFYF